MLDCGLGKEEKAFDPMYGAASEVATGSSDDLAEFVTSLAVETYLT